MHTSLKQRAFTLVELLTVIAIIAVLMGLLFPAVNGVRDSAKKTQATNDATQLVNAVKAFYTEYGRYPLPTGASGEDFTYDAGNPNQTLIRILTAKETATPMLNPRKIVFLEPPAAKETGRYGVEFGSNGAPSSDFLDPWGTPYRVRIDSDYNNSVRELGTGNLLTNGVIAWSAGKDGQDGGSATAAEFKDNAMSWR